MSLQVLHYDPDGFEIFLVVGRIALFGGFREWWLWDHETFTEMWAFSKGAVFALKAAIFFSVSSLELAPVVFGQPSTYPYWELRWSLLRNEMPSPATMSCISGHSPYMIYEVWVPRSSMASSVLEPLTILVSKTSSPAGSCPHNLPTYSVKEIGRLSEEFILDSPVCSDITSIFCLENMLCLESKYLPCSGSVA